MPKHKNIKAKNGVTPQQELFCNEFIKDLNATQAALRAKYSKNGARTTASKLLAKDNIQQLIYELNQERLKAVKIDANFVLEELHKIATSDVAEIFDENGKMKNIHDVPPIIRRAISSIETVEYFEGMGRDREQVGEIKKIKLWSKDKALENLGKHLKLFTEKHEIESKTLEDILTASKK